MVTFGENTKDFLVRISGGIHVAITGEAYPEFCDKGIQRAIHEATRKAPQIGKFDSFGINNWLAPSFGHDFSVFSTFLFQQSLCDNTNHAGIQDALIYLEKDEPEFFEQCVLNSYYDLFDNACDKGDSRLHLQVRDSDEHIDTFAKFFAYAQRRDRRVDRHRQRVVARDAYALAANPKYISLEPHAMWTNTSLQEENSLDVEWSIFMENF